MTVRCGVPARPQFACWGESGYPIVILPPSLVYDCLVCAIWHSIETFPKTGVPGKQGPQQARIWLAGWKAFLWLAGARRICMLPLLIFVGILVVAGILVVGIYNGLVQLRVRADNSWSDIDVQLKRRHDLIPNLVETVKGYATHERGTFENVARYRSAAMAATSAADRAQAEGQLTQALRGLLAVAENYPELKANTQFQALQNSLSELEDSLQNSRRYYNAVVRDLNTRIQSFPSNMIAGMFNFQQRQFFEIADATERAVPSVKF